MTNLDCINWPEYCEGEDCVCCDRFVPYTETKVEDQVRSDLFWENHTCDGDCGDCCLVNECDLVE